MKTASLRPDNPLSIAVFSTIVSSCSLWVPVSQAASLIGLGDLSGGSNANGQAIRILPPCGGSPLSKGFYSDVLSISADGSVVVGQSLGANGFEAFRWQNGVMTAIYQNNSLRWIRNSYSPPYLVRKNTS
jgi:probable HAF family extracellular repeat protein